MCGSASSRTMPSCPESLGHEVHSWRTVMAMATTVADLHATIDERAARTLRGVLKGNVLLPRERGYDEARRVFNAMIDRYPALIVRPADTDDVRRCVLFAREQGLPLSIKGGGHHVAGNAVCDGGLMLDLCGWKGISIDVEQRLVVALPGLLLGELDRATQAFGLATALGTVSITGIAGLTLGGGIGWLNGTLGLACDNVVAVEMVTADGELRRVSADEHADLFWAIRGGSGNFGVVTSFTYRLHPVGPMLVGSLVYAPQETRVALRAYLDFAQTCPDELSTITNLGTDEDGQTLLGITYCWAGTPDDAARALIPLRECGHLVEDESEVMDYLALQGVIDERFPEGRQHYWKSNFVRQLSDEAIEVMLHFAATRPSPGAIHSAAGASRCSIALQHVHGAAARVDPAATAFAHRGDRFDYLLLSQWTDPADAERHIAWTREFFAAMRPHVERAVYVNGLEDEGEERVREAYGANFPRLAAIKAIYDPSNLFRANQNIRPAT
jgi:FAD/FMN-containing dehydrogenase